MKEQDHIRIRGARVHNLKNVDLDIPLRKLICFAGPSGSGKTSLAFHTLLSESRRRFVNSFPNSMKFFADRPAAVDVDEIFPVLPVFGLPQINPVMGSRSVVADIMRMTETLQGLYFHYAKEYCPTHNEEVRVVPFSQQLANFIAGRKGEVWHLVISAELGQAILGLDFAPPRSWSSERKTMGTFDPADDYWEVFRFKESTLASLDQKNADTIKKIEGRPIFLWAEGQKKLLPFGYVSMRKCPKCDYAGKQGLTASAFTPHSALGACKACSGFGANLVYDPKKMVDRELAVDENGIAFLKFGPLDWWHAQLLKVMKKRKWPTDVPIKKLPKEFFKVLDEGEGDWEGFEGVKTYLESKRYKPAVRVFMRKMQKEEICSVCQGSRLDEKVQNHRFKFGGRFLSLGEFAGMTIAELQQLLDSVTASPAGHVADLLKDLRHKGQLATSMGLGHLFLGRKTRSLSAGEYQRLLLLKYLSFQGTDALFILDEPSLGLGTEEQKMLLKGLREVINQGNTVIVIDHSETMLKASDHLFVMGPESGSRGGEVLFQGPTKDWKFPVAASFAPLKSVTAKAAGFIEVKGASSFGKEWGDFKLPLGQLTWVHGSSGTGKSSCLVKVLAQGIHREMYKENLVDEPGSCESIKGHKGLVDVIVVDSNLNRYTSRSSVGSLTELAPAVRKHFLKLPVAKAMGIKDGHLSPNSELGMCVRCEGRGHLVIEMQYLEDIVLPCDDCKGKRIKPLYAEISDGYMSVADAFNRPLNEVLSRIDLTPKFKRTWEYMKILNLDYLSLERPLNSLSGGERQRLYLLSKLLKDIEESLIVFENLSFGLSSKEILRVGEFLRDLAQKNNTLVVIDAEPLFGKIAHAEMVFDGQKIQTRSLH